MASKYRKARQNTPMKASAGMWNDMSEFVRNSKTSIAGGISKSGLQSGATVVKALNVESTESIAPFSPVVIKNAPFGIHSYAWGEALTFDVEKPSTTNNYKGVYGFTLSSGIKAGEGGFIVVAGPALVAVPRLFTTPSLRPTGLTEHRHWERNRWVIVNDGSLTPEYQSVPTHTGALGHFEITSPFTYEIPQYVGHDNAEASELVLVNMDSRPSEGTICTCAPFSYNGEIVGRNADDGAMLCPKAYVWPVLMNYSPAIRDPDELYLDSQGDTKFPFFAFNKSEKPVPTDDWVTVAYHRPFNRLLITSFLGDC